MSVLVFFFFFSQESWQGLLYPPHVWQVGLSNTDEVESLISLPNPCLLSQTSLLQMPSSRQKSRGSWGLIAFSRPPRLIHWFQSHDPTFRMSPESEFFLPHPTLPPIPLVSSRSQDPL